MTIYERIKALRISQQMSQTDLAIKMGYKDGSMITKIESGKVDISQKKIVAFANVLGTTPAYLMGWLEDDSNQQARNLSADESQLLDQYRALNIDGKQYVRQQVQIAQVMFGEKPADVPAAASD